MPEPQAPFDAAHSPVRRLRTRLSRLRRRIRTLRVVQIASRWLLAAVVTVVLFFLADWLLDLPLAVRRFLRLGLVDGPGVLPVLAWIPLLLIALFLAVAGSRARSALAPMFSFVAGGLTGVLVWYAYALWRPMGSALPDEDLALAVEGRFRTLNDRLAAALDFERELGHPSRGESAPMMTAVVEEAGREAEGLAFTQAASASRALRWAGVAALALLLAAGIGFAARETVGLFFERSILARDVSWPKRTRVVAIDWRADPGEEPVGTLHDPQVPYRVAVGRTLTVFARAQGEVPSELLLLDHVEDAKPLPRRMFPVEGTDDVFQVEVRDVRRPFAFVLRGGDDDDDEPRYRVEITVPPRIESLAGQVTYPEYLGLPDEVIDGGRLTVPEGAEITLTFETNEPVLEARAVFGSQVLAAEAVDAERTSFRVAFPATESQRYRLQLRTEDGRENDPSTDTYEIRVKADEAPSVRWVEPRQLVETTPVGRVPLVALAEDDYGVAGLRLEIGEPGVDVRTIELAPYDPDADPTSGPLGSDGPVGATDGPWGRDTIRAYLPVEVRNLSASAPLAAGARLRFRLLVRDSKGQEHDGPWTPVEVLTPSVRERSLSGLRAGVRTELTAILAEQRARHEQLSGLVGEPFGDVERDLARTVQFAQAKIAQDADTAIRTILGIFNAFTLDRLGAESSNAKILVRMDRLLRRTYGNAQPAEDAAASLLRPHPVYPYTFYAGLVAAWKDRAIFDTGLIDRMLAVIERGLEVATRDGPAAHAAVAALVTGDGDLQAAIDAQAAMIARLEALMVEIGSWQNLNQLIVEVRNMIEVQEAQSVNLSSGASRR